MRNAGRFFCLCTLALLLSACGVSTVYSPGSKTRYPAQRLPAQAKTAPGTQRPYMIQGKTYYPLPSAQGYRETGIASWYGRKFHGRKTANGETYNMHATTAAHKTLPMNTYLLVKNLGNGKKTVVRVNDRGPFVQGRIIDLSLTVARRLDIVKNGTARVRLTALGEAVTAGKNGGGNRRFLPHRDFNRGVFFVQIGSFKDRNNAEKLRQRVIKWGKKAFVLPYDNGAETYFRVRVAAGTRLNEARRTARVLEEVGLPGLVVAQ